MNIDDLPENTHLPRIVADAFVQQVFHFEYKLDYSLDALFNELENIFEDPRITNRTFTITDGGQEQTHDFENALASYLGETFVQRYDGQWAGFFSNNSGTNFYTSFIRFGDFIFRPFFYVGYRISNGVDDTGDLKLLVSSHKKSMLDGIDYKELKMQKIIAQGKIAIDNEPGS